jgi:hypothetical protein
VFHDIDSKIGGIFMIILKSLFYVIIDMFPALCSVHTVVSCLIVLDLSGVLPSARHCGVNFSSHFYNLNKQKSHLANSI